MSQVTVKISLETYQELVLRKINNGIPISVQIDNLVLGAKNAKSNRKKSLSKRNKIHA